MEQRQPHDSTVSRSAGPAVRAVLAATALVVFVWLARQASRGETAPFDAVIRNAIHAWASDWLTATMKLATQLGSAPFVIVAGLLAVWRLAASARRRAAALLVVATAGAEAIGQLLKFAFHRPRPEPFFGLADPLSYSFPSTHAMISCCFYGALAAILATSSRSPYVKAGLWALAAAVALAVGFSRVYLGVHYPSDVVAGYAAAVMWALALRAVHSAWLATNYRP
ncbi:MAG: phosphatase PAP2 family protein [Bryobacteraceae bacterium]|jgi:undecaprenyl-diphosphatase